MLRSNDKAIAMLNRTSPKRLTFIVLALLLGILIGLAIFPAGDLAGAQSAVDCTTVEEISQTECLALKALFDDTNGPGWTNKSGWEDTNTPCSTWYGITCGAGQVTRIELPGNNLSGTLPAAVSNLSQLQVLLLNQNALTGSIPPQLNQLTNMSRLNLADNQLNGSIPGELGDLDQLLELSLGYNDLTGTIPVELSQMTDLVTLELVSNTLEGPIPGELGNLTNLGWLDVTSNTLTGTIPANLGSSPNLATLLVASNRLHGVVPDQLCSVFMMTLGYNKLDSVNVAACLENVDTDQWKTSQTLPPTDLVATTPNPGEVQLNWTPVNQLVDLGYYQILKSQTSGGPYTLVDTTADKSTNSYMLNGLDPNIELFFIVRTVTPANVNNQSELISEDSNEAPTTPNAIALSDFQVNRSLPYYWPAAATVLILLSIGTILIVSKRA